MKRNVSVAEWRGVTRVHPEIMQEILVVSCFVTPSVPFALLTALVPLKEGQCL